MYTIWEMRASRESIESLVRRYPIRSARYPEPNELVAVRITAVSDEGYYVQLLQYKHQDGMITRSHTSRRNRTFLRKGLGTIAMVKTVDYDKGYIDLSIRDVLPGEKFVAWDRYNLEKKIHRMAMQLAHYMHCEPEFYYDMIKVEESAMTLKEKLLKLIDENYWIDYFGKYNLPSHAGTRWLELLRHEIAPPVYNMQVVVSLTSLEGIEHIKIILRDIRDKCIESGVEAKVKYMSAPRYCILFSSTDLTQIDRVKNIVQDYPYDVNVDSIQHACR